MSHKRLELQDKLEKILGSKNVYFQPPNTVKMQYPCIVYRRKEINVLHANDNPYITKTAYTLTAINSDPDKLLFEKLISLPYVSFERHYTADNLNHDVYNIYY